MSQQAAVCRTSLSWLASGLCELALVHLDQVFGLAAGTVDVFVETVGITAERGDDIAGIEAARARLEPGDDPAFAVPEAGGVCESGEGPHPVGAGLGAAHLEIVATS